MAQPTTDAEIRQTILALAAERGAEKTLCPSEVARALRAEEETWRALMPQVRQVAQALAAP